MGFRPRRSVEQGVRDLVDKFAAGILTDSLTDPRYFNIETMRRLGLE